MNFFITKILTNPLLFVLIFIFVFIIPILIKRTRNESRKITKGILNRNSIIVDSELLIQTISILYLLIFILVGIYIMYFTAFYSESISSKIVGIVIGGGICCLIPIIIIAKIYMKIIRIKMGKFIIMVDELADKYYFNDNTTDPEKDYSSWKLYFRDYFKKYDESINILNKALGNKYKKNDKFYLVFVKGCSSPYIYPLSEYTLDENEKDKLKNIDDVEILKKPKKVVTKKKESKNENIISQKRIIKDFNNKGNLKTAIFSIFLSIFTLIFFLISLLFFKHVIASILTFLVFGLMAFMTIVKIQYMYEIIKNIKSGKFKITKDTVISLNDSVRLRDSNDIMFFKFNDYKKYLC